MLLEKVGPPEQEEEDIERSRVVESDYCLEPEKFNPVCKLVLDWQILQNPENILKPESEDGKDRIK